MFNISLSFMIERGERKKEGGGKLENSSNIIPQLQTLRAIAFVGIVLCHSRIFNGMLACLGPWAVSVFFVLSGFVMVYSYYKKSRIKKISCFSNVFFAYSKLKKLWYLHLICTFAIVLTWFSENNFEPILYSITKIILNIAMIQGFFPIQGSSINGVSWFLCTILLSYFIFPYYLTLIEKKYSIRFALFVIIFCVVLQYFISSLSFNLSAMIINSSLQDFSIDKNVSSWLVYAFPFSRMLDVIIGYNLGYLFINQKFQLKSIYSTLFETVGLILSILSCLFYIKYNQEFSEQLTNNLTFMSLLGLSFVFVFSSIFLVYSFSMQNGYLSNYLTNKITIFFAKISPYGYLLHSVIFYYSYKVLYHIPRYSASELFNNHYIIWGLFLFVFIVTIILSKIWLVLFDKKFENK